MSPIVFEFAEKQSHYTGANNKRKWVIKNKEFLLKIFQEHSFRPGSLAKTLGTSYATVKRFLCSAGLWHLANIEKRDYKGGRKRTASIDKFGYKYADSQNDVVKSTGEIVRRYEHHVVAEAKYGRSLKEKEVVHHIDLDKTNNSPENIFICDDNKHHRQLHGNLERVAGEAVRKGLIKFHPDHGYYLDDKIGVIGDE